MQTTPILESPGLDEQSQSRSRITDALRTMGLRTRDIIKLDLDEDNDPRELLLLLAGKSPTSNRVSQPLDEHVSDVETEARSIADRLHLAPGDPTREARKLRSQVARRRQTQPRLGSDLLAVPRTRGHSGQIRQVLRPQETRRLSS